MLRSLVGSEMCIRDRSTITGGLKAVGLADEATNGINVFNSLYSRLSPRCLLYTSDAADDLLCVDLGGRRIIKKKNSIETKSKRKLHNIRTYTSVSKLDLRRRARGN